MSGETVVETHTLIKRTADYIWDQLKGASVFGIPVSSTDGIDNPTDLLIVAAYFFGQKSSPLWNWEYSANFKAQKEQPKEDPIPSNFMSEIRKSDPNMKYLGCPHMEKGNSFYPEPYRTFLLGDHTCLILCPNCSGLVVETVLKEFTNRSVVIK